MSHSRGKRTKGYRSRLEALVAARLKKMKVEFSYEDEKFPYVVEKTYTPDFNLESGIHLEVEGVLMPNDRSKYSHVKKCNPDVTFVFVFANPDQKVPGTKRMTHAQWAERNGFKWLKAGDFKKKDLR